ncbi:uncharacterized protein LOC144526420 [Sander vitreus]
MAPSQVSGMMMRNLLFGVIILGLLAVVHSTPVNTVTQIPTKVEDEVFKEAMTEGFLVEPYFLMSLTTESPKRNTTVKASTQQPSSDSKERGMIEGNAAGDTNDKTSTFLQFATTTPSVSHVQSSTVEVVLPRVTVHSSPDSSTSQSHQSSFTSSSVPSKAQSSVTPDHISVSQTTYPAVSTFDFLSSWSSDLGSGDGEMLGQYSTTTTSTTSSSNTDTSTAASTSTAAFIQPKALVTFAGSEGSGDGSGMEFSTVSTSIVVNAIFNDVQKPHKVEQQDIVLAPKNKEHSTPGWIMILAFMVGFAALVIVFVAIATRDKWSGPRQASQIETKTNFSNQQRGLEMETFLHKDELMVNGKAGDYTVISLDEIPDKHSSH